MGKEFHLLCLYVHNELHLVRKVSRDGLTLPALEHVLDLPFAACEVKFWLLRHVENPKRLGDSDSGSNGRGAAIFLALDGRDAVELDCDPAHKCSVGAKEGTPVSKREGRSP